MVNKVLGISHQHLCDFLGEKKPVSREGRRIATGRARCHIFGDS
jgi:hypothetical protein